MSKTKLTLYIDTEVIDRAKRMSKIMGKSISGLVTDYINEQYSISNDFKISEKVSKWAGFANSDKGYRQLRDEVIEDKMERYEGTD